MNNHEHQKDTAAWIFQVWASFGIALSTTLFAIYHLPVDAWVRGYMLMGLFFTVGSTFTLAKTIRDNHEATRLISRLTDAKNEKIIREFELEESRPQAA